MTKSVFVTVGTTRFDELINTVHSDVILDKLEALGYGEVTLQVGDGYGEIVERSHAGVQLHYVRYVAAFADEIRRADLVISHAGAGSCLEALRVGRPLIVVINEALMDNHQLELAKQLQSDAYVYYANCKGLKAVLDKNITDLKKYPKASKHLFSNYLNKAMGFA